MSNPFASSTPVPLVVALLVSASVLCTGCANWRSPSRETVLEDNKAYWLSYDASRRGTVVVPTTSKGFRSCSEPAPDVAQSLSNALKGDFKLPQNVSATGVDFQSSVTALALGGRDEVVLLAREGLYRICEASINQNMSAEQVGNLITSLLQQVENIAKAQAETAKNRADEAEKNLQRAKVLAPTK